jgi:hypothetical protein
VCILSQWDPDWEKNQKLERNTGGSTQDEAQSVHAVWEEINPIGKVSHWIENGTNNLKGKNQPYWAQAGPENFLSTLIVDYAVVLENQSDRDHLVKGEGANLHKREGVGYLC